MRKRIRAHPRASASAAVGDQYLLKHFGAPAAHRLRTLRVPGNLVCASHAQAHMSAPPRKREHRGSAISIFLNIIFLQ
jgi:hypothetical protein